MPSVLLLPLPRFVAYYPGTGAPLAGGFVSTFVPGSSTPKQTYQDALGTIINPQPIVLDSAGSCLLYGTGAIEIRTTDALGNAIPAYSGVVTGIAPAVIPGFISGLILTNDVSLPLAVLDIAPGVASDTSATATITLPSAFSKSISGAWVAGTGAPGMGIGVTTALNRWLHVFVALISGLVDVFFDTSATGANAPPGTSAFRRIGSIKLGSASPDIVPFLQFGNRFKWVTSIPEFSGAPGVTTAVLQTLLGAPLGISTTALLTGRMLDPSFAGNILYLSSPGQADQIPSILFAITCQTAVVNGGASYAASIDTNTLSQIRMRVTGATSTFTISNQGWVDGRGAF